MMMLRGTKRGPKTVTFRRSASLFPAVHLRDSGGTSVISSLALRNKQHKGQREQSRGEFWTLREKANDRAGPTGIR